MKHKTKMNNASWAMILLLSLVLSFSAIGSAYAVGELLNAPKSASTNSILAGAGKTIAQYAVGALGAVGAALIGIMAHLTNLGGAFFDLSLNYNLDLRDKLVSVYSGWIVSRDIANLLFILILLGISIATILRISTHQAKSLLPRLIIIALLINFSFSIGLVVIDFTNILGKQFYDVITENGAKRVSEIIMQKTEVQAVFDDRDADLAAQNTWLQRMFKTLVRQDAFGPIGQLWLQLTNAAGNDLDQALIFAKISWGNLIILAVITFVFFVGGIILLIRPVILALLLTLAPIAFLFYILPDTESYWKKWWSTLISHSFFLPAFLFLLYVAILLITSVSAGLPSGSALNNAPLVFNYILSIILLLAALILGKSMGVYGADTAIAWSTAARKWLTGAVGGLAARHTTGVFGTAITPVAAKFQETRFGQVFGTAPTKFAGWLKGLGGAETRAGAMADFAKQLTPERQAKYFAGLNAQEKVALLGKMTPEQQAEMTEFMSPADRMLAEGIIKRQMPLVAAAKFDLESWKRLSPPEQTAQFGNYSPEAQAQILRSFPDDEKRAEFVLKKLSGAAQSSAKNILASPAFITAEQLSYNKAEKRQEMRNAELKGGTAFEDFINSKDPGEQKRYFKAAEDRQRVLWLEKMHTNATALGRYQNSVKSELNPEEQAKFNSEVLRRVSTPAVTSYVDALPQTEAEKVVVTLSADQQAALYIRWAKDKPRLSVVEKATGALSADQKKNFYTSLAQQTGQKNIAEVADIYLDLPPETQSIVWQRNPTKMVSVVEYVKGANPDAHARMASVALKQGGLKRETIKAIITPEIIKHPEMVETIISSGSMGSIEAITGGDKAKIKALQDAVSNSIAQTTKDAGKIPNVKAKIRTSKPFQDLKAASGGMISDEDAFEEVLKTEKDFRAEALAEMMEEKNNRLMAKQIRDTLAGIASAAHQEILNRLLGT